ncbi:MAG TPA: OmpH family outer membrane protein [Parvibaculum sp.]|uniref:OmpH family outer membrane protein n=1 Tax=Parvibaculum sp. TaxID=2024848 RepID=UPI002D066FCE|nr:OmpH family outer membrane protein [Parvibaculum sp.]HMM14156.1 OmpH family outer membrane protein [Parvibaculum sp.]
MKSYRYVARTIAALAFASFISLAAAPAAKAATPAVILIVNTEQVFAQAKVGVSVREQLQDLAKKLQAEDKKGQDAIEAEAKKLTEQRALLKPEDLQKKYEALQKKEADHQRKMRQKGQELQLGANKARSEIEAAIRPIFAEIMKKNNATILLDQSVVLAGGVDLDVTAEVLKELDAKLTTISVKPVPLSEVAKGQKGAQ